MSIAKHYPLSCIPSSTSKIEQVSGNRRVSQSNTPTKQKVRVGKPGKEVNKIELAALGKLDRSSGSRAAKHGLTRQSDEYRLARASSKRQRKSGKCTQDLADNSKWHQAAAVEANTNASNMINGLLRFFRWAAV